MFNDENEQFIEFTMFITFISYLGVICKLPCAHMQEQKNRRQTNKQNQDSIHKVSE